MKMVDADTAIRLLDEAEANNVEILGIDGFIILSEGYEASLGLLLDVSSDPALSNKSRAEIARHFIKTKRASNIEFEVWTEQDGKPNLSR